MNRQAWAWQRFQRRSGWILSPGETALCVFGVAIVILFGADAIRAYFWLVRFVAHGITGATP